MNHGNNSQIPYVSQNELLVNWGVVKHGVPQDLVLGSLLFLLYKTIKK
jgi:hypothetical protein